MASTIAQQGSYEASPDQERLLTLNSLRVIVGSGLGLFMGTGILLLFTIGVFVGPIAQDTGWDRAAISAAAVPASFMLGILAPFVGTLVDRFGPRRVLFVSTVLQALGMLCITLGSSSVMMFGLMFVVASMLGCAQAPVPFSYVIVGWFRARRGIAMGMTFTFAGLGIAIVPPLAALLIESFGWRTAYALLGAGALCVSLPSAIWLIVDPPAVESARRAICPGSRFERRCASRPSGCWPPPSSSMRSSPPRDRSRCPPCWATAESSPPLPPWR
jgi:MFS family permease